MKKFIRYILAGIFAFFFTNFGLFAGLQLAPIIGDIILFPLIIAAWISDTGFGLFPNIIRIPLWLLTILFWAWVSLKVWDLLFNREKEN